MRLRRIVRDLTPSAALPLTIRPATADDDAVTIAILRLGDLSTRQPQAIAFYRSQPNSRAFVGSLDGDPVAVGLGVLFGEAGWVGNIAVRPDHRRRGYGTAVTEAVVSWLQARGARTVLLTATVEGSKTYERIGFVEDGGVVYGTWIRRGDAAVAAPRSPSPVVGLGALEDALALDARATGEDRAAYLAPFADRVRVTADRTAYRIGLPWGAGPIIAGSVEGGWALLADLLEYDADPRLGFPDSNPAATQAAAEAGFDRIAEDLRMRLGPPVVGFNPDMVFCVLSFVCG